MAEETIDIGLRIDASEIPAEVKKAFDQLDQEMQQRGQAGGALGERIGQSYSRVRARSEEAEQQGFFSPHGKRDLIREAAELQQLHRRYWDDRIQIVKTFQERAAKGEFTSEDQMRTKFGKTIESEANVMMTELNARTLNIERMQALSREMGEGTEAYNSLQKILNEITKETLPAFNLGLRGVTTVLEWLVPSSYVAPGKAAQDAATGSYLDDVRWSVGTDYQTLVQDSMKWKPAPREDVGEMLWDTGGHLWNSVKSHVAEMWEGGLTGDEFKRRESMKRGGRGGTPEADRPRSSALAGAPARYQDLITQSAKSSGVPAALLTRVMKQESNFDPNAVSPVGAVGLMQLMPKSFPQYSRKELFQPGVNIPVGTEYFAEQIDRFGSVRKGLAAYNMGPTKLSKTLKKYGDEWESHLPPETSRYIQNIHGRSGSGRAQGALPAYSPDKTTPKERRGYLDNTMGSGGSGGELGLTGSLRVTVDVNQPDGRTTSTTRTMSTADSGLNIDLMRAAPGGRGLHAQQNSPHLGSKR